MLVPTFSEVCQQSNISDGLFISQFLTEKQEVTYIMILSTRVI